MEQVPGPRAQGLYDPRFEHDSCGIGFVVDAHGRKSHSIVDQAIQVLLNLEHRGACGCEKNTGDGAGILMQMPHAFLADECGKAGFALPGPGGYGAGLVFLPTDAAARGRCEELFEKVAAEECVPFLGWRTVPTENGTLGVTARAAEPVMRQAFVGRPEPLEDDLAYERKLYVLRRRVENAVRASDIPGRAMFYVPSLSQRTLVYKGMLIAPQLPAYFPDIVDERVESALAMVHSRFSTNTFPNWARAHPYRFVVPQRRDQHAARQRQLDARPREPVRVEAVRRRPEEDPARGRQRGQRLGDVRQRARAAGAGRPLAAARDDDDDPGAVGRARVDEREEARVLRVPLVPDGAVGRPRLDRVHRRRAHRRDARPQRPAPVALLRDQGRAGGAGLRGRRARHPRRTACCRRAACSPGACSSSTRRKGGSSADEEIKLRTANEKPYAHWLRDNIVTLQDVPEAPEVHGVDHETVLQRQLAFGYTREDLEQLLAPMAREGVEPVGAMGNDTPLAVLSDKPQLLYNYFKQLFAQVTNPPVDAIREEIIMAVDTTIGPERNLLEPTPLSAHQIKLATPMLTNDELEKLRSLDTPKGRSGAWAFRSRTIPILFRAAEGGRGLERALDEACRAASQAIRDGINVIVLSDRGLDAEKGADPGAARGRGRAPPPDPRGQRAPASGSCSRAASRARCTTSRC